MLHKKAQDVKQVGVLYEIWHCEAANTYAKIKESGFEQLTTELIIQSNGQKNLSDVYPFQTDNHDIYNVQPKLGFIAFVHQDQKARLIANCPMVSEVAKAHAKMLYNGGLTTLQSTLLTGLLWVLTQQMFLLYGP